MDEQETKTPAPGGSPQPEAEPYLFYNVMPKTGGGEVVAPKVSVAASGSAQPDDKPATVKSPSKITKYLAWAGLVLAVCGLGYLVYEHFAPSSVPAAQPLPVHRAVSTSTPASAGSATTPAAWQEKYFGSASCQNLSICGDSADPDRDGLTNLQEYKDGTDPNNPDSDADGLSDGDETNVFLTNPLNGNSGKDPQYSDAQNIAGGYDPATNAKYTTAGLEALKQRMKQYGLHEPTLTTLGDALINLYDFTPAASGTPPSMLNSSSTPATSTPAGAASSTVLGAFITGFDGSAEARQDRDAQRTNTIQTIAMTLLKYRNVNKNFPGTSDFSAMYSAIKPYNLIATNPVDPINQPPFVYGYTPEGGDFMLSFYSETQNQLIKINSQDAEKYAAQQAASNNDGQRKSDLESLQSALLLYSSANAAGNQDYVFPTQDKYKAALAPQYISAVPVDPQTGKDYDYEVSSTFDTFTLRTVLQNPATGSTGYMCNQLECGYY